MTGDHIEVVREALSRRWGGDYRFPGMPEQLWKDANAALDSIEDELAQVREREIRQAEAADAERSAYLQAQAGLTQVREERDAAFGLLGEAVDAWDEEMRGFDPDYIIRARAALTGETP